MLTTPSGFCSLGRHFLGVVFYAMPAWVAISTYFIVCQFNLNTPFGSDSEGDAWLVILAIAFTVWSVPGYALSYWASQGKRPGNHLTSGRAFFTGSIALILMYPLFFFLSGPFFSWLHRLLNLSAQARELSWLLMEFLLIPTLAAVFAAWLVSLFPRPTNKK